MPILGAYYVPYPFAFDQALPLFGIREVKSVVTSANSPSNALGGGYISADISNSPFHPIAEFSQKVTGFDVTISRTVSYERKSTYQDVDGNTVEYTAVEANLSYNYTDTFINLGQYSLGFREDVAEGDLLEVPDKEISINGWGDCYSEKFNVPTQDQVGTWSTITKDRNGNTTSDRSGTVVIVSRSKNNALIYGDKGGILVENEPNTMYYSIGSGEGARLRLKEDGEFPVFVPDSNNWFGSSHYAFELTKEAHTDRDGTSVSAPTLSSGSVNMEGLKVWGARNPDYTGDPLITASYGGSQSLTWNYRT